MSGARPCAGAVGVTLPVSAAVWPTGDLAEFG